MLPLRFGKGPLIKSKLMRSFGCGEEGLTLIELLIVVGILNILAAVVTP